MKTPSIPANFQILEDTIRLSKTHKKLAECFYTWCDLIEKGKRRGNWMGYSHIANRIGCHKSTVKRFFRENQHLIATKKTSRYTQTYEPNPEFLGAIKFLKMHEKWDVDLRTQKRFLMRMVKRELEISLHRENVGICTPLMPNLHPYSLYDSLLKRSSSTKIPEPHKSGFFLKTGELLNTIEASEGAVRYITHNLQMRIKRTIANYNWYASQHKIDSPEAMLISVFNNTNHRITFDMLRDQRDKGRKIKNSYRI